MAVLPAEGDPTWCCQQALPSAPRRADGFKCREGTDPSAARPKVHVPFYAYSVTP